MKSHFSNLVTHLAMFAKYSDPNFVENSDSIVYLIPMCIEQGIPPN